MQHIRTLEEFTEHVSPVEKSFRFGKMFKASPVVSPDKAPSELCGRWVQVDKHSSVSKTITFVLSVNGLVKCDLGAVSELTVLLRLGKTIERHGIEDKVQVLSIALPKAMGFSGIEYGHLQVRDLFPHLAR